MVWAFLWQKERIVLKSEFPTGNQVNDYGGQHGSTRGRGRGHSLHQGGVGTNRGGGVVTNRGEGVVV